MGVIDVLIGSDFYWRFVTGKVQRRGNDPVAIYSKLGWPLSGSIDPSQTIGDTCTHLILAKSSMATIPEVHDPVQDILHKFWDTVSIGIVDTEHEGTSENVQFYDNDYEVSLPWREGHFDLPKHFSISINHLRYLQIKLPRDPDLRTEYHHISIIEQDNASMQR